MSDKKKELKEQLTGLVLDLTKLKIAYYRKLGVEEIIIDLVVSEVFDSIYEYLDEEYGHLLDQTTPQDMVDDLIGGAK